MHPADPKACSWQPGVTADTFSKPEVPLHCLRVGISFPLFHRPFHFSISDGFLKEKHTNHKNTHFRCILNFFFFKWTCWSWSSLPMYSLKISNRLFANNLYLQEKTSNCFTQELGWHHLHASKKWFKEVRGPSVFCRLPENPLCTWCSQAGDGC